MIVRFYEETEDAKLKFAVVIALYNGKFVLCKHKNRDSLELPGGHREKSEDIITTARRELYEETGATKFTLKEISIYSVEGEDGIVNTKEETFGKLFYAEITEFEKSINSEIEKIELYDDIPYSNLTYPIIHSLLLERYYNYIKK